MQELAKIDFKINVMPNGQEKYMSFNITNRSLLNDSFQYLSSALDRLVKNLGADDFKYLCQEFDNDVLDLVKQNGFYLYEYMSDFEKLKEEFLVLK